MAAAATTEKGVLEELVKSNADRATTNNDLSALVASLIKANEKLSHRVGNRRTNNNTNTGETSPVPLPKALSPHRKIKLMHAPENCFMLYKNAVRRRRGWKIWV